MRILVGVALVAVLSTLSYVGIERLVSSQETDAPTINVSGRQRMLSQRVSLMTVRYVSATDPVERRRIGELLDAAIELMGDSHDALVHGRRQMGISSAQSAQVRELYRGAPRLDLRVADYLGWARALRRLPDRELGLEHPLVQRMLAESEKPLLRDLNQAVTYYEEESSLRVAGLKDMQLGLLGATLLLLLVEVLVIFWPMVKMTVRHVRRVRERETALRLVLDSTADALFVIDEEGALLGRVRSRWDDDLARVEPFLDDSDRALTISREELGTHVARLAAGAPYEELLVEVRSWHHEPVGQQLEHLASSASRIAQRLDKPVEAFVEASSVRLPAASLAAFWSSLVHVVRNAVDHGIEAPDVRERSGKPPIGRVAFSCFLVDETVHVTIRDDGQGVDWDVLRDKAEAQGRDVDPDDLTALLFESGLSSRDHATPLSGRGVGLAVVREAVDALDGEITVISRAGRGTCVHVRFPAPSAADPLGPQGPQTFEIALGAG